MKNRRWWWWRSNNVNNDDDNDNDEDKYNDDDNDNDNYDDADDDDNGYDNDDEKPQVAGKTNGLSVKPISIVDQAQQQHWTVTSTTYICVVYCGVYHCFFLLYDALVQAPAQDCNQYNICMALVWPGWSVSSCTALVRITLHCDPLLLSRLAEQWKEASL